MKRLLGAPGACRRLILRVFPLLLGGSMAGAAFTGAEKMAYWSPPAAVFGVLAGVFMILGAAGWLIFCYRAERDAARDRPWRRGVLECYGVSGLCCLGTAVVRATVSGAPPAAYGSELIFGCAVLLATGAVWLRWRQTLREADAEEPWDL